MNMNAETNKHAMERTKDIEMDGKSLTDDLASEELKVLNRKKLNKRRWQISGLCGGAKSLVL